MADFKYKQVADNLRVCIGEGTFKPGERIPTEPELCERFHVGDRRSPQGGSADGRGRISGGGFREAVRMSVNGKKTTMASLGEMHRNM